MPLGMVSSIASVHFGGKMDVVSISSISVSNSLQQKRKEYEEHEGQPDKLKILLVKTGIEYTTHN